MWKIAALTFTAARMAGPVVIEITRCIVHARRVERDGLGGTQDLAMWGTFISLGRGVLAAVGWGVWCWSRP